MKISANCEIERIVCTDVTRPHLTSVYLDTAKRRVCATNGHMLAIVPTREINAHDTDGPVTPDAIKAARKRDLLKVTADVDIVANGSLVLANGTSMPRPEPVKFPPVDQVIPSYRADDKGDHEAPPTVTVSFNVNYLLDLARAIGAHKGSATVTLTFPMPNAERGMLDPIVVEGGDEGAIGVLMPYRR